VVRRHPVELLDDLEGNRLRSLGVERAQGDVGELDAGRERQLAAGPVGLVVVAVELDDCGAERPAGAGLAGEETAVPTLPVETQPISSLPSSSRRAIAIETTRSL
jgi:hypothetical protein